MSFVSSFDRIGMLDIPSNNDASPILTSPFSIDALEHCRDGVSLIFSPLFMLLVNIMNTSWTCGIEDFVNSKIRLIPAQTPYGILQRRYYSGVPPALRSPPHRRMGHSIYFTPTWVVITLSSTPGGQSDHRLGRSVYITFAQLS